jgi:hypothetical protein
VRAVEPVRGARGLRLRLRTAGDVELELWGARRNGDLLEAALGVPARIECAAERRAAPRRLARTA